MFSGSKRAADIVKMPRAERRPDLKAAKLLEPKPQRITFTNSHHWGGAEVTAMILKGLDKTGGFSDF